jgi:hypothetical protein
MKSLLTKIYSFTSKLSELVRVSIMAIFLFSFACIAECYFAGSGFYVATVIGTVAAGVGVTTTLATTYVPQYLIFTVGTTPSQLKINALGDGVVMDLDAAGLTALRGIRRYSQIADYYFMPLADGIIQGKNVEITVTNQDAAAFTLFGSSKQKGFAYVQSLRQVCLANSGVDFKKFAYLSFPSMAANDELNVTFKDGHTQKFSREELESWLGNNQNETSSRYSLDNLDGNVSIANFIGAAQQTAYLVRYGAAVGALDNSIVATKG